MFIFRPGLHHVATAKLTSRQEAPWNACMPVHES